MLALQAHQPQLRGGSFEPGHAQHVHQPHVQPHLQALHQKSSGVHMCRHASHRIKNILQLYILSISIAIQPLDS